ncbi:MAG TPA: hypothetical protein VGO45_04010 [Bacteroidia bacterium]|jgi:hypothetical protein|nr:hypothetical protein [Bacteroidia bacterium]
MNELIFDDPNYPERPEIIRQVAAQVIKDFEMFGLTIVFNGDMLNVYSELFDQVSKQLEDLIKKDQQRFISILYRIDLSEQQVKKALSDNPSRSFSAVLTDLILKRELQKVILRNRFRDH